MDEDEDSSWYYDAMRYESKDYPTTVITKQDDNTWAIATHNTPKKTPLRWVIL